MRHKSRLVVVLTVMAVLLTAAPVSAEQPQRPPDNGGSETANELNDELNTVPGEIVVDFVDDLNSHLDDDTAPGHTSEDGNRSSDRNATAENERRRVKAKADEIARRIRSERGSGRPAAGDATDGRVEMDLASGGALLAGGMTVVYNPSNPTPSYAKAAIEAGIDAWSGELNLNGAAVVVEINWVSFGSTDLLGFAGPVDFVDGNQLPTSLRYPVALANVLTGADHNGAASPEIVVALNSDLQGAGMWYYGDGTPPWDQIDLRTVVTHEMGHGVGFVSSASDTAGSIELASPPFIYDFQARYQGTPIQNVGNLNAALTSENVDIQISTSQTESLFAPATWSQGTSISHLSASGATSSSLMVPSLKGGTTSRRIDGHTLGVLNRMGWPTSRSAITPLINSVSVDGASVWLGWLARNTNSGLPADRYRIDAYKGSTKKASVTISGASRSGGVSKLDPNTSYQIRLVPITNGVAGTAAVRTITTGDGPVYGNPQPPPSFVGDNALDSQIFRVYQAHFLRVPDVAGFNFWRDQRARGMSLLEIIVEFQAGQEFLGRYGSLDNRQFVELVYRNVLGRDADSSGLNHWVNQLASGQTRAEMMQQFVESTEYINRTSTVPPHSAAEGSVRRLYQAYFLRVPATADISYWTGVVESGTPLASVSDFFSGSTEFVNRYGNVNNAAFVNLVYQNVLQRTADTSGFNHWTAQLAAGTTRGEVMLGFSESAEFIKATGTIPWR